MERVVANSVVTRAFCLTTPTIRSRVHFFPSAGTIAGHYPVSCELTLFGKGIQRRSVKLEGGRLNQPDGIRLEDAFPALDHETSGVCGLEVVFECSQARINLSTSRLVVEIVSPQFALTYGAVPFRPTVLHDGEGNDPSASGKGQVGIAMQDSYMTPSLIVVNPTEELLRPDFRYTTLRDADAPLQLGTVAAESVVEFPLDDALCKNASAHELLWGRAAVERMRGGESWGRGRSACYILYRDPASKRPISVCAL
jgi:hypothetical protein